MVFAEAQQEALSGALSHHAPHLQEHEGHDYTLLASGWTDDPGDLVPLIHSSIRPVQLTRSTDFTKASEAVERYYSQDFQAVEKIQVFQVSGPFRSRAWQELRRLEAGQQISYQELARRAGNQKAYRAAASACAKNAAALFIPCHRVVHAHGGLGGFRYRLDIKQHLLELEAGS